MRRLEGLVGKICRDMGVGPGWDCGRYRLDGPNGLFLYCRVSMISMILCLSSRLLYLFFSTDADGREDVQGVSLLDETGCFSKAAGSVNGWEAGLRDGLASFTILCRFFLLSSKEQEP